MFPAVYTFKVLTWLVTLTVVSDAEVYFVQTPQWSIRNYFLHNDFTKKKFLGFLTWKRSCLICFHAWLQLDCVHNANGPSLSSYINLTIFRYVLLLPNWKWDHFRTEQMALTTRRVVMGPSLSQDRVFWKAQAQYLEKGPSPRRFRARHLEKGQKISTF